MRVTIASSLWENLSYFRSLAIHLATKPQCGLYEKVRTDIPLAGGVCFEVPCLKKFENFIEFGFTHELKADKSI